VVGATLLDQALAAGHDVRALVRDPARLPTPPRSVDRLAVTRGDAADPTAVKEVVAGCDAVLSTLGGVRGPESMSAGIDVILTAMRSTASAGSSSCRASISPCRATRTTPASC
jgi:putative NADH-flavin reductase